MNSRERQTIEALIAREEAELGKFIEYFEESGKPGTHPSLQDVRVRFHVEGRIEGLRMALQEADVAKATGEDDLRELNMSQMRDQLRQLQARVDSLGSANELAAAVCVRLDEDMKRALSALGLRT